MTRFLLHDKGRKNYVIWFLLHVTVPSKSHSLLIRYGKMGPQNVGFFFTRPDGIRWGEKRCRSTQTFFLSWLKQLRAVETDTTPTFFKNKVQKWRFLHRFWVEIPPPSQDSGSTYLPKSDILKPKLIKNPHFGKNALPQIIRNSAPSTPSELIFGSFDSWEPQLSNDAQTSVWGVYWAEICTDFDRVTINF